MNLLYHPDYTEEIRASSIGKFIEKDLARHPLKKNVIAFLNRFKSLSNLDSLFKSGDIKKIGEGLYEMRIPPVRHGGVARVYFSYAINDPQTLIILDAELKHDREAQKIERARTRFTSYTKGVQQK